METRVKAGVSADASGRVLLTPADAAAALLLFAATVIYFVELPHNLGFTDEGGFLYEAKRLLDGDVFYRDIFEIITPGSHYLMALLFRLFGTTIATAKAATAVIHGVTVCAAYLAGRTLRLPRAIAAIPALAYPALCAPAWPYSSPHWITTCVSLVLLLLVLRGSWRERPSRTLLLGIWIGVLIAVMQQKGAIMGVGVAVTLAGHHLVDRHYGTRRPLHVLGAQLAYLIAGALLVILPFLATVTVLAGLGPTVRALVEHPLTQYKNVNQARWGDVQWLTGGLAVFTVPPLLKYLPIALALELLRAAWNWVGRKNPDEVRGLMTLIIFGVFSAVSIVYLPDFIHVAFIAPVFFIAAAECLEWALAALDRSRRVGAVTRVAIASCLWAALAFQLGRIFVGMRAMYPTSAVTAFGRIDFSSPKELDFIANTEKLLANSTSREIFSYPVYPALYLITGTRNPTPYQIFIRNYTVADQYEQAIAILESRKVPVIFLFKPFLRDDDPVLRYVRDHYVMQDDKPGFWKRADARE